MSSNIEHKYGECSVKCYSPHCVHKPAANNAVRAELNYRLHILELNDAYLLNNAYLDVMKLFLKKLNFPHVWANQSTFSKAKLLHAVTVKLKDSYVSFWRKCLFDDSSNVTTGNGNKLRTYRTFKTSYCLEN